MVLKVFEVTLLIAKIALLLFPTPLKGQPERDTELVSPTYFATVEPNGSFLR
jgi:hypothetical protein